MTVMDNDDPADPSVREPRVIDPPESVWLVYGDLECDASHHECCASGEVTWCEDPQFAVDVRYTRTDRVGELVSAAIAAERDMWRKLLLGPHLYRGDCPDSANWHARDPKCKACRALGEWKA